MRAVGYVRVSKVGGRGGDSFLSPDLQREQIAAAARREGLDVVEVLEELDASGGGLLDLALVARHHDPRRGVGLAHGFLQDRRDVRVQPGRTRARGSAGSGRSSTPPGCAARSHFGAPAVRPEDAPQLRVG